MSYELFAWPVDTALPAHVAIAEIRVRAERRSIGFGRDRRVKAFASAMDEQYPGLGTASSPIPMEFDVHRDWVRLALPWTMARDLLGPIAWIAFEGRDGSAASRYRSATWTSTSGWPPRPSGRSRTASGSCPARTSTRRFATRSATPGSGLAVGEAARSRAPIRRRGCSSHRRA